MWKNYIFPGLCCGIQINGDRFQELLWHFDKIYIFQTTPSFCHNHVKRGIQNKVKRLRWTLLRKSIKLRSKLDLWLGCQCSSAVTGFPVDIGRKFNVHKSFRRRPGRLLNVLCTFNLRPVSTGLCAVTNIFFSFFFLLSGFSSQTLTIHRALGAGRGPSFIPL